MEHTQRIYWSDLTFEKQEEIKKGLEQELRDNKDFMSEIKGQAEDKIREDEEENTKRNLDWNMDNLIEKEVEDIIGQTFFCQVTMEY
ncbi:MAG: hypothetical protein PHE32_04115 [Candidatus Shapirobacteria bacterium]|jgi:ribosome recycling factor|nr:hypothetical protein [Candidatus Shapirobacteria bacterium]